LGGFPTITGNVQVVSTLQLWGTEINGAFTAFRRPGLEITFLAGFRYADLLESLSILGSSTTLAAPAFVTNTQDHFDTRNQFYGGQIGSRITWQRNRLSVDLTGKLALGSTHEVVDIHGSSFQSLGPVALPYGFFTEPSNSGRFTDN
jgi:hypothetical protein